MKSSKMLITAALFALGTSTAMAAANPVVQCYNAQAAAVVKLTAALFKAAGQQCAGHPVDAVKFTEKLNKYLDAVNVRLHKIDSVPPGCDHTFVGFGLGIGFSGLDITTTSSFFATTVAVDDVTAVLTSFGGVNCDGM